jgi:hypothetical protein
VSADNLGVVSKQVVEVGRALEIEREGVRVEEVVVQMGVVPGRKGGGVVVETVKLRKQGAGKSLSDVWDVQELGVESKK